MDADVTMRFKFDRPENALLEFYIDLLQQGYSRNELDCALGALVGATGAFHSERFFMGLAGGATVAQEHCKARKAMLDP